MARAARDETDERVAEEAADVLYHLAVLMAERGMELSDAYEVLNGRRRERPGADALARRGARARARPLARPAAAHVHRRLRDARVRLPEAARRRALVPAGVGRAGTAGRPLVVPRLPPARRDPALPAASTPRPVRGWWTRSSPATGSRRSTACRRSPAARWACSATTSCAAPSPPSASRTRTTLGMPELAVMVTDVLLAFDHLRHEVTVLANVVGRRTTWSAPTRRRPRRSPTCASACAGPVPQAAAGRREPPRVRVEHRRGRATPRRSSARRSTSAPATSTRWCRASAGAPTARWTRSRSTAACARSTRARTCTSSTSRTSRSRARRPRRS